MTTSAQAIYAYQLRVYLRSLWTSVLSRLLAPVMFLLALGVGLGSLVDSATGGGITVGDQVVPYLAYLVPAILAIQGMSAAIGEATWPISNRIMWSRTYEAMLATPATVRDILTAHVAYVATQVAMSAVLFMVVAAPFGAFSSWAALACVPVTVLVGLAFTTPLVAYAAHLGADPSTGFNVVYRLVQTPLLLFSGTFFPISQLPVWLQPVAWVTPLWHGVEANRELSLGLDTPLVLAGHVAVLLLYTGVGWAFAMRSLRRRLVR